MHALVEGSRHMYRGPTITGLSCVIKEKEKKTKAKSRESDMLEMIYWGKIASVSSIYKYEILKNKKNI